MILEYIMGTALILIMASGAYCLFEQARYEQKEWEKRRDERKRND
jgi:hypothetical protein